MSRTLVIGFGNIDRADDGVAYYIVNSLRKHLGGKELNEGETGIEDLDSPESGKAGSIFLIQLTPELVDILAGYERIVFVDAHIDPGMPDLHCAPVQPDSAAPLFSHHMTPAMLLALTGVIHGRKPHGYLVSARGLDFDFHRGLSPETEALVQPAVRKILEWIDAVERAGAAS